MDEDAMSLFLGVCNPRSGSSIGLELVKLLGGGFDSFPGRTRVYFNDVEALKIQVPSAARIYARTPPGSLVDERGKLLESRTVDVRVDRLDELGVVVESATLPEIFTYSRVYRSTFDAVTRVVIRALRSLVGATFIDVAADYTLDGAVVLPAQLPAVLIEGPNLIRDEFRSGRDVTTYAAGNQVPRQIPPWARVVSYEIVVIDKDRGRALQTIGHLVRWMDSGPTLTILGRQVEVQESLPNQFRAVQVAGQDYTNDRVVAYRGGVNLLGVEIEGESWDIAVEVQEAQLALDEL